MSSSAARAAMPGSLCEGARREAAILDCLGRSLGSFWSSRLHRRLRQPVHLAARSSLVPVRCRAAQRRTLAYTCPTDRAAYLSGRFWAVVDAAVPASERRYAVAVVLAHEMGHYLQDVVGQPQLRRPMTSSGVRFVENQADCLAGVWAGGQIRRGVLSRAGFLRAERAVLTAVDTTTEAQTHGPVATRLDYVRRGLAASSAAGCHLAGPSR